MRRTVLPGLVLAAAAVVWAVAVAVVVHAALGSVARPERAALTARPPALAALDRAIARARPFVDGLYGTRADGGAAISEYYGVPLRARAAGRDRWLLLGAGDNRIDRVDSSRTVEVGRVTFRDDTARLDGRLAVDWGRGDGLARVRFVPHRLSGVDRVDLALGDASLGSVTPATLGRPLTLDLSLGRRDRFRSARFTVRHATNEGQEYERYLGEPGRAVALDRTSRAGGFVRGRDVYAPMWSASGRWGDGMPFSAAAYADCDRRLPPDDRTYEYRSKTCTVPERAYAWVSSLDPLARMLQGLHVLDRHGDPRRPYADPDHDRVTVSDEIGRWERLYRGQEGIPRCSPVSCDSSWSSGVRTAVFGALETELGYGAGDRVSRSYADRAAALVLASQVPDSGVVRTAYGTLLRPLARGGFAIGWRRGMVLGFSTKVVGRAQDAVVNDLSMPEEYVGFIPSNAETTLAAFAFLVRYRCRRYGTGCVGQFARAPGTPTR